jgi:hypothetical protein
MSALSQPQVIAYNLTDIIFSPFALVVSNGFNETIATVKASAYGVTPGHPVRQRKNAVIYAAVTAFEVNKAL